MTIGDLLAALSPSALRELVLPFPTHREAFVPRFAITTSHAAMEAEVTRFVAYMLNRRYCNDPALGWPALEVDRVTEELFRSIGGWRPAMQLMHDGGMRKLLDTLTERLQERALLAYLEAGLLGEIEALSPADRFRLGEAYLDEFRHLGVELEHPALLLNWWPRILHEHARLVLAPEPPCRR